MTVRERFARTMRFEQVDRMPILEWATWWDKTVHNWIGQGLEIRPVPGLNQGQALQQQMGLDLHLQAWVGFKTAATPSPKGEGLPIVTSMAEYERILPTLYPDRVPIDRERMEEYSRRQAEGSAIVWATIEGPFWGPRTLLGIENHLYSFYDEPELLHRINADIARYNLKILDALYEYFIPDFITLAEDMSYNNGPMLSEALFDEFLLPYYHQVLPSLKERGVPVFIDSDGDITKMVPWFIRAGIDGVLPLERQAGVDVSALRDKYPTFLFIGHYDKMVMPHGEEAMRAEFERLLPAMRKGGFIASVDHQTPPGVSLDQYRTYIKLLNEYAVKAVQG